MRDPLSRRTFLRLGSSVALGLAAVPAWRILARTAPSASVERAAYVMGSIVTVTAYGDESVCNTAITQAFRSMKAVDALMSVYDPRSPLSALNRSGGLGPVAVPTELTALLQASREFSRTTGGAFDVTVKPLLELYGFLDAPVPRRIPDDRTIAATLDAVGSRHLLIDEAHSTVAFGSPHTRIDLGGIAVGHALDRAGAVLRAHGVESALVNHSGDLLAIGAPPGETGWEVGITDPVRNDELCTSVRIRDEALSTSGNYRNFRRIDHRTFGHIVDPAVGRPSEAALSTTVIAPDATTADALSTATFVLGPSFAATLGARKVITVVAGARPGTIRIL